MRKSLLVYGVLLFSIISCDQESDYNDLVSLETAKPVITGFALRDPNNVYLSSVGIPNNKLTSRINPEWVMKAYPIPAVETIQIGFNKPGLKKVTLLAAKVCDELLERPFFNGSQAEEPEGTIVLSETTTDNELIVDVSSLPEGVYRLYIKHDGELFWENILISQSSDF